VMKLHKSVPLVHYYPYTIHFGWLESLFMKTERDDLGLYRRMFAEDFAKLFHSFNRRSEKSFELTSNDEELAKKLLKSIRTSFDSSTIDEAIRYFIEDISKSLIFEGKAYYFLHKDCEQDSVHTASFDSFGVMRFLNTYLQWVPKRTERQVGDDSKELPRELRFFNACNVLRFYIPSTIKALLSKQNRVLNTIDFHHRTAEKYILSGSKDGMPIQKTYFDFEYWKELEEKALFKSTRLTGWSCRAYHHPKKSDFFDCHRLIRLRRNQVNFRDSILSQICSELSRVGKAYNSNFSITITCTDNLLSLSKLNELEDKLKEESVGFDEIMDYCFGKA